MFPCHLGDAMWSQRWNRIRTELTFTDVLLDVSGKVLVALGLGTLFAKWLERYALSLIVVGLILSGLVKAKYWKRFWRE